MVRYALFFHRSVPYSDCSRFPSFGWSVVIAGNPLRCGMRVQLRQKKKIKDFFGHSVSTSERGKPRADGRMGGLGSFVALRQFCSTDKGEFQSNSV